MTYERPRDLACPTCNNVAALKLKAEELQRLIACLPPPPAGLPETPRAEVAQHRAASAWATDIASYLRREMDPHPKCSACGILMGEGHIEPGTDGLCGTCRATRRAGEGSARSPAVGRRGWHSDHAVPR